MASKFCGEQGHLFEFLSTKKYQDLNPAPDMVKKCANCERVLIHINGTWVEPPKPEQKKREPKPVDNRQMSLF